MVRYTIPAGLVLHLFHRRCLAVWLSSCLSVKLTGCLGCLAGSMSMWQLGRIVDRRSLVIGRLHRMQEQKQGREHELCVHDSQVRSPHATATLFHAPASREGFNNGGCTSERCNGRSGRQEA